MNYFAHGVAFLDRPYRLAGTAVPDWLMVADRRLRVRPRQVEACLKQARADAALNCSETCLDPFTELVQGIWQHLADDRRFHANPAFLELSYRLSREVAELLDGQHLPTLRAGSLPETVESPSGMAAPRSHSGGREDLGRGTVGRNTTGGEADRGCLDRENVRRTAIGRDSVGKGPLPREEVPLAAAPESDAPGGYAAFVGHLLLEVLLDAAIIEENPARLEQYYQTLDQVDVQLVQEAVNRLTPRQTFRLAPMIAEFRRLRVLWDYLEDWKLLFRLNQVMRRVKLPELPEAFFDLLPKARQAVASRKQQLLEGIPSGRESVDPRLFPRQGPPIRIPPW